MFNAKFILTVVLRGQIKYTFLGSSLSCACRWIPGMFACINVNFRDVGSEFHFLLCQ